MPTRRRRTTNNTLPPRKLPACLGHQEAKPSTHPSILMDYLLKCNQTQPSFPRPEAATMNHDVKKEVHPSIKLSHPGVTQRQDFFFFFLWLREPPGFGPIHTCSKGQRSDKQINVVVPGRTETSPAGWEETQWRWGRWRAGGPGWCSRLAQRPLHQGPPYHPASEVWGELRRLQQP